jgi:hypothetical protein
MLRMAGLPLTMIALLAFATPADSQERCPELTRLYAEADAALGKTAGLVTPERCYAYVHFSVAWAEVAKYAHDHRELCDISPASLSDIDQRHHKAVAEREDACGGRRRNSALSEHRERTFPPEIRPRW